MREAGSPGAFSSPPPQLDPRGLPPEINAGTAHSARVYDYWLGGKDNFAADRALGDALTAAVPSTPFAARANRAFLGRAVRYLAAEAGVTQFLDIGTGIPTAGNTHEVAQAAAQQSRVVYVDHDPGKPGCSHARYADNTKVPRDRRMITGQAKRGVRCSPHPPLEQLVALLPH